MTLREHSVSFRVRYAETDQMGFAHHANYLVYFEMARIEMLRAAGWNYQAIEERGFFLVVAQATVKYRSPARYDDALDLLVKVERVTAVRIEHSYRLTRGETLVAEGATTLACVDRAGHLQALPPELGPPS